MTAIYGSELDLPPLLAALGITLTTRLMTERHIILAHWVASLRAGEGHDPQLEPTSEPLSGRNQIRDRGAAGAYWSATGLYAVPGIPRRHVLSVAVAHRAQSCAGETAARALGRNGLTPKKKGPGKGPSGGM